MKASVEPIYSFIYIPNLSFQLFSQRNFSCYGSLMSYLWNELHSKFGSFNYPVYVQTTLSFTTLTSTEIPYLMTSYYQQFLFVSLPVFILGSAFSHVSLLLEQLFYWRISDHPFLLLRIASKTPPAPQSLWAITPTQPCGCLLLLLLYSSTLRLFRIKVSFLGFTYYKTYCAVTMYINV